MGEWVTRTTIGDLKGLSQGSIPPFPTKNQGEGSLNPNSGTFTEDRPLEARPKPEALPHRYARLQRLWSVPFQP